MPQSKILIADDHGIVRSGIKALIKQNLGIDEVYEASNETEIIKQVKSAFFDLILMDIHIPGMDYIGTMSWLINTSPGSNIIVFTTYPENVYGEQSIFLGAKGFLNKTASNSIIVQAIKAVLSGSTYFNGQIGKNGSPLENGVKTINVFEKLSSKEMEIALLINKGHSLPEICSILNIQYSTANTYKRRIFEKLNIQNAVMLSHLMQKLNIGD